jgi:hypothetical protein
MEVVLKIASQGQTHRIPFVSMPDYTTLMSAVKESIPQCSSFSAKYMDDDDDLCTLVEYTFPDFLTTASSTESGQAILRLELLPLAESTYAITVNPLLPDGRPRSKPMWECDSRDLDELLQQFVDEPVASKKRRRKKKSRMANSVADPVPPEDDNITIAPESEKSEPQEEPSETTDVDVSSGHETSEHIRCASEEEQSLLQEQVFNGDGGYGNCIEALWEIMTDDGLDDEYSEQHGQEYHGNYGECLLSKDLWLPEIGPSPHSQWQMQCDNNSDFTDVHVSVMPRRVASCPCLSNWSSSENEEIGEGRSLVDQAWPFVDTDKYSVDASGCFSDQEFMTHPDYTIAEAPVPTLPQSPPSELCNPQVVWVPMLMSGMAAEAFTSKCIAQSRTWSIQHQPSAEDPAPVIS